MLRLLACWFVTVAMSMLLLLVATTATNALTVYTVNGHVTDIATGLPIQGVCIIIGPPAACPPTAPISNANGDWTTQLIDGSTWDVWYSKIGYNLVKDTIPASIPSNPVVLNKQLTSNGQVPPGSCPAPTVGTPTQSVYLPNITKTLGGATGFQTPFIVQNTSTTTATNLEVTFYKFSDGSCVTRRTVTALAGGTSFADVPNNDADLPDDSQFSVVVRSFGARIVSVVNEHAGFGVRAEALSYDGFSSGATTVSLPNIVRRFFGYHTPFIIQNLGTLPTTATASFLPFGGGPAVTVQRTIAPGQSQFIEPNVEPVLTDGKQYGVTVTATQPIAVVVNTHNDAPTVANPVAYSADGIAVGGNTLYAPYFAKNASRVGVSTMVVQNVGSGPATPSLKFTPLGGGNATTLSLGSVNASNSVAFDPRYTNGNTAQPLCGAAASPGCLADGEYTVEVSAGGGTTAAAVSVIGTASAMGYTALTQATPKYFLPNVTRTLGGVDGWTTPILLQSTTATTATLAWYRFTDGVLVTSQSVALTPGSGVRIDPRSVPGLTDDTQYAVVATGSGNIAAIVVELATGGDNAMIYEGFPSP